MTSGNPIEAMAAANLLPKNWAQMSPDARRGFQQQQETGRSRR